METIATESSSSRPSVAVRPTDAAIVQMDAEAASKGFGKAYAAFGGGREGLEACAASEHFVLTCHLIIASIDVQLVISTEGVPTFGEAGKALEPVLQASPVYQYRFQSIHQECKERCAAAFGGGRDSL